jgi:hypothetical protein
MPCADLARPVRRSTLHTRTRERGVGRPAGRGPVGDDRRLARGDESGGNQWFGVRAQNLPRVMVEGLVALMFGRARAVPGRPKLLADHEARRAAIIDIDAADEPWEVGIRSSPRPRHSE